MGNSVFISYSEKSKAGKMRLLMFKKNGGMHLVSTGKCKYLMTDSFVSFSRVIFYIKIKEHAFRFTFPFHFDAASVFPLVFLCM